MSTQKKTLGKVKTSQPRKPKHVCQLPPAELQAIKDESYAQGFTDAKAAFITPEELREAVRVAQDEARKVGLGNGRSNTLDDVYRAILARRDLVEDGGYLRFTFGKRGARLDELDEVTKEIVKLTKEKTDDNQ